MAPDLEVDVAVVGAGAAGLSLAWHLARLGRRAPSVALLEPPPGPLTSPVRTWCSWQRPADLAAGPAAGAVSAAWPQVDVVGPDAVRTSLDLAPWTYAMVRSTDLDRVVRASLAAAGSTTPVEVLVERVVDDSDAPGAVVRGRDGECRPVSVRARWVVDTRPPAPPAGGRTALLQHFRGWFVRTREDVFDPASATLMDFRTPQPPRAVSFGYVLPTSAREALVEYTEFSRAPLPGDAYDAALRAYCRASGLPEDLEVTAVEQGAIPMTDASFARRPSPRVLRLGTAGGATRPSTGYTFASAQRQAAAVAEALALGADPGPPPPWSRRHLWMDAVLLRALDSGRLEGARFLADLFRRNPTARVLRFLDGQSSLAEDLALMRSSPLVPMVRTAGELLLPPRRRTGREVVA